LEAFQDRIRIRKRLSASVYLAAILERKSEGGAFGRALLRRAVFVSQKPRELLVRRQDRGRRWRRFVAELPGSKAEGYESDDEVVMSATAYPGNWQDPVFFGDGKWDD
jgi:hypothetical protein